LVAEFSSANTLRNLLQRMDAICRSLEDVVLSEQKAIHLFDIEALIELTAFRHDCQQELQHLETACHEIIRQYDVPDKLSLETFIDIYLPNTAPDLQALRRSLYQRLTNLNKSNEENSLRLRASYDVTSSILHNTGLLELKRTYGPGGIL